MRWQGERRSENVEDRRGVRLGRPAAAVGGAGILIVLLVVILGGDPSQILSVLSSTDTGYTQTHTSIESSAQEDELVDFVTAVLGSTEDVWSSQFEALGEQYAPPRLVLFRDAVESGCGVASTVVGPFYCPSDSRVYIDLAFYEDLRRDLGAPGDFAQAYVIAHEVGHHVQNLLGISEATRAAQRATDEAGANERSVRLELQADFLAGLWAHHANKERAILEAGDVEEALNAAAAIGDDRLQRRAQGQVTSDTFTHGTSAQRVRWFKLGLETGDLRRGDTFSARDL